jgi:hypothetical protein
VTIADLLGFECFEGSVSEAQRRDEMRKFLMTAVALGAIAAAGPVMAAEGGAEFYKTADAGGGEFYRTADAGGAEFYKSADAGGSELYQNAAAGGSESYKLADAGGSESVRLS